MRRLIACLVAVATAAPALAGPLDLSTRLLAERRVAAADGGVTTEWVPAVKAVPGDRLTVVLGYRNTGAQPLADLQLANPVPAGLAYRSPVAPAPEPEVSVDGHRFAGLAQLAVATPGGGTRPATLDDVTHVRWRLARPLAPGASGSLAFRAVLR